MINIYLDLDGVMVDFERHYLDLFGHAHDSVSDNLMWDHIKSDDGFFRNSPPMAGAISFFGYLIEEYKNVTILTACPKSDYSRSAKHKREWVREHLSIYVPVIPMLHGVNKCLFMHQPGDVLIDDFEKNIKPWNSIGGYGILHKSIINTKQVLDHYMLVKKAD
jgi:5'(3')-deoxyribonucleotidase